MPRTLINLDAADKAWLKREAGRWRVSMTELVRQAVRSFRMEQQRVDRSTFDEAQAQTAGIWRSGDGLAWRQRRLVLVNTKDFDDAAVALRLNCGHI